MHRHPNGYAATEASGQVSGFGVGVQPHRHPGNEATDEAAGESLLQRVLLPRVAIKVAPMKSALHVPSVIEGDQQRSRGFLQPRSHPRRALDLLPTSLPCNEPPPSSEEARRHPERKASPVGDEHG